jgi:fructoselysine-6-P-deglycase FrlB-like protein
MSHVAVEIASQREVWQRALELAADPRTIDALPKPGERVAVVGCGTTLYMAQCCAARRETAPDGGETDAFPASEFPYDRHYDRVVALTRSGTTTEVVRLLERLPATQRSTVITTDLAHPVATLAGDTILLDFADEESVVQTRFATAALVVWRAVVTGGIGTALDDVAAQIATDLDPALVACTQFTFLGTGWTVGLANEAGLKLREASQSWAECYPAMEFRHGPISVVDGRSAVWVFGPIPEGLADDIAATGARLVHEDGIDPMAHLVAAQRLAVALAESKGLDPDQPRSLTRSIVLSAAG